jgi:GMP synthase (glutamine-hydrolysing)
MPRTRKQDGVNVAVIRHVAFEDLGVLAELFAARNWNVTYIEAPVADWDAFDPMVPDLLVVLGGPIGVYEDDFYPFLKQEVAGLERRLKADKPTLGICLGAQLIAAALGAHVYPNREKEIGWSPLILSAAGYKSPVRHVGAESTFMFHWHGDTFDLPTDATLLAGTGVCFHQIFSWGKNTLAFQCHPEVIGRDLEKWFVGHAVEIAATQGAHVKSLRADTKRYAANLEKQARLCFTEWLDSLGLA